MDGKYDLGGLMAPVLSSLQGGGGQDGNRHFFPRKVAVSLNIANVVKPIVGAKTYIIRTG